MQSNAEWKWCASSSKLFGGDIFIMLITWVLQQGKLKIFELPARYQNELKRSKIVTMLLLRFDEFEFDQDMVHFYFAFKIV